MNFPLNTEAINHLSTRDPMLGRLIRTAGPIQRGVSSEPFIALASSIVAQQLSAAAADTIWARLADLAQPLTPKAFLALDETSLRACGISFQKIGYIRNIAFAFESGNLTDTFLRSADDDAVIEALTKIKGVGRWTAEMFMMFCLNRDDVFSYGDLGLRKGMAWLYGLPSDPTPAFAKAVNAQWSPYNTIASLYLWEITLKNWFKLPLSQVLYPEFQEITGDVDYSASPIGSLKIVSSPQGLTEVSLCSAKATTSSACPLIHETKKQLTEYFAGVRQVFDLPLAPQDSEKKQVVATALRTIPYGETRCYSVLTPLIGTKASAQLVAAEAQKNRLLIIIPSHRVMRADGKFSYESQQQLCALEANMLTKL